MAETNKESGAERQKETVLMTLSEPRTATSCI